MSLASNQWRSRSFGKGGGGRHVSAPFSFIAGAQNEPYAFNTRKSDLLNCTMSVKICPERTTVARQNTADIWPKTKDLCVAAVTWHNSDDVISCLESWLR